MKRCDDTPGHHSARSPVAFVLSSGASLGAVQIGMLRALVEHYVYPDMIVGCSVGAINGAGLAEDPTIDGVARLEQLWRSTEARRLVPRGWWSTMALARRSEAIQAGDNVHSLLQRTLTATTFEQLRVPFQCVATDVMLETEAWFHEGPLIEAVLASSARPAMFPSVEIDRCRYLDGAIVNDVPVRRAAELGARTLYVLEVGVLSRSWQEPKRPLGSATQACWIARRHRYKHELQALPDDVEVHLMPPGSPPPRRFPDVSHSSELIDGAYEASTAYLDQIGLRADDVSRAAPGRGRS